VILSQVFVIMDIDANRSHLSLYLHLLSLRPQSDRPTGSLSPMHIPDDDEDEIRNRYSSPRQEAFGIPRSASSPSYVVEVAILVDTT
jgi:hypothetical protein